MFTTLTYLLIVLLLTATILVAFRCITCRNSNNCTTTNDLQEAFKLEDEYNRYFNSKKTYA